MQLYDNKLHEMKDGVEQQIRTLTEGLVYMSESGGTVVVTEEKGFVVSHHSVGQFPLQVKVGNMAIAAHVYRVYPWLLITVSWTRPRFACTTPLRLTRPLSPRRPQWSTGIQAPRSLPAASSTFRRLSITC